MKALLATILLTGGLFLVLGSNPFGSGTTPAVLAPSFPDVDSPLSEGERLDGVREASLRFGAERLRMKAAVLSGSLTLSEAAERLIESARRDCPIFLKVVGDRFPGLPQREQVAQTFLSHLEVDEAVGSLTPDERDVLARLRREREANEEHSGLSREEGR